MTDEDAAWLAQAKPVAETTCDACFMIADAFRSSSTVAPLVPPGLQGRSPGWLSTHEVLGREDELIAYYKRLLAAGAGKLGTSAWHPYPYFAVRPAILAGGERITAFSWTDDVPETETVLRALIEPALDDLLLDDQEQGWAIRVIRTGGMTAFIEWDAEGPPPTVGGWMVKTAVLAEEAGAALERLGIVHSRLVAASRRDYWTYRPPWLERRAPGRFMRLFWAWKLQASWS